MTAKKKPGAKPIAPKGKKVVPVKLLKRNGMTQPAVGTKTRRIWDIADAIQAKKPKGQYALRTEVMAKCKAAGLEPFSVSSQFQNWRTFFGVPKSTNAGAPKATGKKTAVVLPPDKKAAKAAKPKTKPAAKKAAAKLPKPAPVKVVAKKAPAKKTKAPAKPKTAKKKSAVTAPTPVDVGPADIAPSSV